MVYTENGRLLREYDGERLLIEAFGQNSLRVRVTRLRDFPQEDWALLPQPEQEVQISLTQEERVTGDEPS